MKTYLTDPLSQCQGKHPFPTHNIAQATISNKRGVALHPYKCQHCGFYHIGHVPEHTTPKYRKATKKDVQRFQSETD